MELSRRSLVAARCDREEPLPRWGLLFSNALYMSARAPIPAAMAAAAMASSADVPIMAIAS